MQQSEVVTPLGTEVVKQLHSPLMGTDDIIDMVINALGSWPPQRDVVVNADCSDSQRKTRGAKTVWNISAGAGHLHKGMSLRGVL